MFYPKTTFMQHDYFPKIPLKSYLPQQSNPNLPQLGTAFNQIKLLVPLPSALEPRNISIKPINNKAYYKLHYQICLHKLEMIPSKIKPKALKPSLTISTQVPLPKSEPNKHTRNS